MVFHAFLKDDLRFQSWSLRCFLLPALYESVTLKSSRKCRVTLTMLANRPDICAHIRKFAVRPNYYLSWPKPDEPLSEDWVVHTIMSIAPSLTSLHTFDWDGLEVPKDCLWGTLRNSYVSALMEINSIDSIFNYSCPKLRNIFSNVGSQPLDPYSQVRSMLLTQVAPNVEWPFSYLNFPTSRASH